LSASSWAPLERACLEPLSAGGAAARAVLDAARQESLELAALGTALDEQQRQYEISRGQIAAVYQVAPSAGIAAVVGARWAFEHLLAPQAAEAFAFNPDFLPVGGALVVLLWSCNALLFSIVFFEWRWRMLTRALDIALNTLWFAALTWLTLGPCIYLSDTTDQGAKGWLSLVAALVLIDVGV
jgi:hypothetical protein